MAEVKLPELGENIDGAEVSAVLVSVGDFVRRDQPVVEIETEKAVAEVPSDLDGRVIELRVAAGDQVRVGQALLQLDTEAEAPLDEAGDKPVHATSGEPADAAPAAVPSEPREDPPGKPGDGAPPVIDFPLPAARERPVIELTAPAAPASRAMARQLGLDINNVPGTGPAGRISREDVKAYAKSIIQGSAALAPGPSTSAPALPDFTRWGPVERERLGAVRRATARNMATAWTTVPHVTQFDHADITQLESMRRRYNQSAEASGRKLTLTSIVVKTAAATLKQFPGFNASLDLAAGEVVLKQYVNIGVAVDTDRGLLVPVVRDVDQKSLVHIAGELNDLAARARDKKLRPEEMQGATFTVSNLGGVGTTYFSPIVNWPEVAILGVGRAEQRAVYEDDQFQPRLILPLSLSYDHRIIDGADAARFQRSLAEALEQPLLLLPDE